MTHTSFLCEFFLFMIKIPEQTKPGDNEESGGFWGKNL